MANRVSPNQLCEWASDAVQNYRKVCFGPNPLNVHETIVRVHLVNCLAKISRVRIEVTGETISKMKKGNTNSFKGNRGGVDIIFGQNEKISGLIEVKRGGPISKGDRDRVFKDVKRLKEIITCDENIDAYVVVVIGAGWAAKREDEIKRGLKLWENCFKNALVAKEKCEDISKRDKSDGWTTVVVDARKCELGAL